MTGSVIKRGRNSWRLKYDIAPDPETGERRTKYATFRGSKKEAEKELARLVTLSVDGVDLAPEKLTVSVYMANWLTKTIKPSVRANTFEGYSIIADRHIIPALGKRKLKALSADDVQSYYAQKLEEGLSANTVQHHHRLLAQAMKQATNARLLAFNPMLAVRAPAKDRKEITVVTKHQLKLIVEAFEGTPLYPMVLLTACTGLRRSEVLGLRWSDIDMEQSNISVRQVIEQTREHGIRISAPKTQASKRRITIPSSCVSVLRLWRRRQDEEFLRLGHGRNNDRHVFTRRDGSAHSPRRFSQAFSEVVRRLDVPPVTLHGLRHTHVTHLLQDGVNAKVVASRVGHASVAFTLDTYGHVIEDLESQATDAVEGWFPDASVE